MHPTIMLQIADEIIADRRREAAGVRLVKRATSDGGREGTRSARHAPGSFSRFILPARRLWA